MPGDTCCCISMMICIYKTHWHVNGLHYRKTSETWLQNMDKYKHEIMPLFRQAYIAQNRLPAENWVYTGVSSL